MNKHPAVTVYSEVFDTDVALRALKGDPLSSPKVMDTLLDQVMTGTTPSGLLNVELTRKF